LINGSNEFPSLRLSYLTLDFEKDFLKTFSPSKTTGFKERTNYTGKQGKNKDGKAGFDAVSLSIFYQTVRTTM
jgi:hypothetical protein